MRVLLPSRSVCRAVIAVAALYALALQAILGGMLSVSALGLDHPICGQSVEAPDGDGPAKPSPVHSHVSCCTAAHTQPAADAPILAASTIVWPQRRAVSIAWRSEVVAIPRAPPGVRASARAPPVV